MVNLKILNSNLKDETTCLKNSNELNYFLQNDIAINGKLWVNSNTSTIILLEGQKINF